ncbi:MAG: hypothetical protein M3326_07725, partial [Actinomycetota bacterium]|nr:hypothetical protein [Actinomycetota bacterium]
MAVAAGLLATSSPSSADVTQVSGSACGYYSDVSLFGGPSSRRGCGQTFNDPQGLTAEVTLPSTGSATPITAEDPTGSRAVYGPAVLFGGQYPNAANDPGQSAPAPSSGPITVSTQGTTGPNGSATSSASIAPGTQGTADPNQPRGIGPGPLIADAVSSTCTASEGPNGTVTLSGSTTVTNGILVTSTTQNGDPATTEAVPTNPPVNYTRTGTINNVGDSFRVVYNEQIVTDNSITVNAIHMYLLGPTAVGDLVIAQSHCDLVVVPSSTTSSSSSSSTTSTTTAPTTTSTTTAPTTTSTTTAPTTTSTTTAPTTTS